MSASKSDVTIYSHLGYICLYLVPLSSYQQYTLACCAMREGHPPHSSRHSPSSAHRILGWQLTKYSNRLRCQQTIGHMNLQFFAHQFRIFLLSETKCPRQVVRVVFARHCGRKGFCAFFVSTSRRDAANRC